MSKHVRNPHILGHFVTAHSLTLFHFCSRAIGAHLMLAAEGHVTTNHVHAWHWIADAKPSQQKSMMILHNLAHYLLTLLLTTLASPHPQIFLLGALSPWEPAEVDGSLFFCSSSPAQTTRLQSLD
jgi:hypothetical protein